MKKTIAAAVTAAVILLAGGWDAAFATPSTTYWSPAVSDVQPYGVWHLGIDNYFTLGRKADKGDLPTDLGLTVGVLPYEKIQLELGIDWLEPTTDPLYFNAKLGTPEGALFEGSPALNIGIYNAGTDRKDATKDGDGRTDYNILDIIVGKTLPMDLGRIHAGLYSGNKKALLDKNGEKKNTGYMIGYDKGFLPAKDDKGEYNKWVFAADYQSGKNAVGAGGFGIYHYFTRDISLLTGPVWFNEPVVAGPNANAKWLWTTQLDINF